MRSIIQEYYQPEITRATTELTEDFDPDGRSRGKTLKMKGVFIQAESRNANGRIYPLAEIKRAVNDINERITKGHSILAQCDHPADLQQSIDRAVGVITEMHVSGNDGLGTMKIIPTPLGNIVKTLLDNGVNLGVSSRGSGEVDESTGIVRNFEIVTVDVVVDPSCAAARPKAIYESLLNMKHGHKIIELGRESNTDVLAQRYLKEELVRVIREFLQKK